MVLDGASVRRTLVRNLDCLKHTSYLLRGTALIGLLLVALIGTLASFLPESAYAVEGDLVVVVAEFETSSEAVSTANIHAVLQAAVEEVGQVTLTTLDQPITDRTQAQAISEEYNAYLVIYGSIAPDGVTVYYEVTPREAAGDEFHVMVLPDHFDVFWPEDVNAAYIQGLTSGQLHYAKEDYESAVVSFSLAIDMLNAALMADARTHILYVNRGVCYYDFLSEYELALADFTRALELDSAAFIAYVSGGETFMDFNNLGTYYSGIGQYEAAIASLTLAIQVDPNPIVYTNRAMAYARLRDYESALADFDQALELDPTYAKAYYNRGLTYDNLGEFESAIADYTLTIELDPNYAKAYNNRGVDYSDLGEFELAVADFARAMEIDPDYTDARQNWEAMYNSLGGSERVLTEYTKAIANAPENSTAYYNRALFYLRLGEYAFALVDLNQALELDSAYVRAYYDRAYLYYSFSDYDLAIDDFTHVLEFTVDDDSTANTYYNQGNVYFNRGSIYAELGEFELAVADLTAAIEYDPTFANAYLKRGYIYDEMLGEYELALADYLACQRLVGANSPDWMLERIAALQSD